MIEIKSVTKTFGDKTVLDAFSASLPCGEITALMGASGSGKTTLLYLIAGLTSPDSGEITGVPGKLAAVFQEDRLAPELSGADNLAVACRIPRDAARAELTRLGLSGSEALPVSGYSGGMKRRVAIARAMLADAELILLDEPLKGLDEATRRSVIDYIKEKAEGKTVLLITHDKADADSLGCRNLISL